tara:strand:+ start:9765 stop:9968 length:204 start_codon:yes stop_codon:yes gene_type:complete
MDKQRELIKENKELKEHNKELINKLYNIQQIINDSVRYLEIENYDNIESIKQVVADVRVDLLESILY